MSVNQEQLTNNPAILERCSICDKTYFSNTRNDNAHVCSSIECMRIYNNQTNPGSNGLKHLYTHQSHIIRERTKKEAADILRHTELREKEEEARLLHLQKENIEFYNNILKQHPELNKLQFPLVVLSSFHQIDIVKASDERKQNYLAHLKTIIDSLESSFNEQDQNNTAQTEAVSNSTDNNDKLAQLNGELCQLCAGRCCFDGGHKAFITEQTIKRYMHNNPDMNFKEVFERYSQAIPKLTYHGSCINHTENGCNLPREMRSETCNNFYCEALTKLKEYTIEKQVEAKGAVVIYRYMNVKASDTPGWDIIS